MKYLPRILVILVPVVALGAVAYIYLNPAPHPAHAAIARDRSDSVQSTCKCSEYLVKEAMKAPGMIKDSTVTLIVSGDESTADEPVLIGTEKVPFSRKVIEGRQAANRQQDALASDLGQKCSAKPITKRSPLVLLVRRSVERLREAGCGRTTNQCLLYVQTDGVETTEPELAKLINGRTKEVKPESIPKIDNAGITVIFFGISETIGEREEKGHKKRFTRTRDTNTADLLRDAWRSVFTTPETVRFEPFCPSK